MIIGRQFAERMYSDYDYEERLYSTGSDEVDYLMERAFCDGYEYAQREFAKRDYEGLSEEGKEKLSQVRSESAKEAIEARKKLNSKYLIDMANAEAADPAYIETAKAQANNERAEKYEEILKEAKKKSNKERKKLLGSAKEKTEETEKQAEKWLKRNWNKLGKGGKIAAVAIPTAAAATAAGVMVHNRRERNRE